MVGHVNDPGIDGWKLDLWTFVSEFPAVLEESSESYAPTEEDLKDV